MSSIGDRMRKFPLGLSRELILDRKTSLLNKHIDNSILVVYMQQVVKEKNKQEASGERKKKARGSD